MEVGAVKQAFNNELILLKKKLNQAKIQIIHKLTRKAKTFVEKKAPEKIKEKFTRKAEAAVNEVLIIKKIKPKDLARFIVTHKGELNSHLNKPNVDIDKACARLSLHKSLHDKYKFIRDRFSSVPIEDLLMSREERKKIKKEAREKQKNKNKVKNTKVVNSEGDWDVEDVEMPAAKGKIEDDLSNDEDDISDDGQFSGEDQKGSSDEESEPGDHDMNGDDIHENDASNGEDSGSESKDDNGIESDKEDASKSENEEEEQDIGKFVKSTPEKTISKAVNSKSTLKAITKDIKQSEKPFEFKSNLKVAPKVVNKIEKKTKDKNKPDKNKNLNEKLLTRKFKKDVDDEIPMQEAKVVDPFFITSTGENYMSVCEPRLPDEVKEEHKQGNRKLRRAAMFGHVPKIKPRRDNFESNNRFNRNNNGFNKNDDFKKFNNSDGGDKRNFTDKRTGFNKNRFDDTKPEKEEKLHPSWEAKKKQSGILPFQGKKIVFDES